MGKNPPGVVGQEINVNPDQLATVERLIAETNEVIKEKGIRFGGVIKVTLEQTYSHSGGTHLYVTVVGDRTHRFFHVSREGKAVELDG